MRRFSEAEKQTIWDMCEAGAPVKRIARHLVRNFEGPGGRSLYSRHRCGPRSVAFGDVPRGQRQRRTQEIPGPGGRPGSLRTGPAAEESQAGGLPATARDRRVRARGEVVTSADLGVVGSGVPRSSGDAGVPRDHLPVALCAKPWSAAQRTPYVFAQRSGEAPAQDLRQGQPHWGGQGAGSLYERCSYLLGDRQCLSSIII